MKYIKSLLFLCLLCFNYFISYSQTITPNELNSVINIQDVMKKLSTGEEEFSLEIFRRISLALSSEDASYNFMISPFTIWSLLVLIAEGAKGNTLEEIRKVLRIQSNVLVVREGYKQIQKAFNVNTSTVEVNALQALFSDKNRPVDPDFEQIIQRTYQANIIPVDFHKVNEAKNSINNYVLNATRGSIDGIVDVNDLKDAQMVLISAIYFKGQWTIPFNRSLTKKEPFYDEKGKIIGNVDMMYNIGNFNYAAVSDFDAHILELPYGKENRLSMVVILPRKGVTLSLVVDKISRYGISRIYSEFAKLTGYEDDEVEVFLPKFSTTSFLTLNVILEQMGILDLFHATKSDLSKISRHPIYLSHILHKTRIEVNEEGTIAAAATGGIFSNKASPPRFYVNRPFAYIIVEKSTNSIVFCGEIRNPLQP